MSNTRKTANDNSYLVVHVRPSGDALPYDGNDEKNVDRMLRTQQLAALLAALIEWYWVGHRAEMTGIAPEDFWLTVHHPDCISLREEIHGWIDRYSPGAVVKFTVRQYDKA